MVREWENEGFFLGQRKVREFYDLSGQGIVERT